MHLRIQHRTTFMYEGRAHDSFNETRLRPSDDATQRCHEFQLRTTPAATSRSYVDFYGNAVNYFELIPPHAILVVESTSLVETVPLERRVRVPQVARTELEDCGESELYAQIYGDSPLVPLEPELLREAELALDAGRQDVWTDVGRLGAHIFRHFAYRPKSTDTQTRATDVLNLRTGVCQDFAHVHLGLCRSIGIPARYVSGYFYSSTRPAPETEASHAWIEAWVPRHGWAAYDPTHNRAVDERYVKVAVGRDYSDIRPVSGTYRGAPTRSMAVNVSVREKSEPVFNRGAASML